MAHRVAVIQNQSDMSHYAYADASSLLEELPPSYVVSPFNADNIEGLTRQLDGTFDAVVLGSNALNDKTIYTYFTQQDTRTAFQSFLQSSRGILVLHQLGLARSVQPVLDLCPDGVSPVRLYPRTASESASEGVLTIPDGASSHNLLNYPNLIDTTKLQRDALSFASLRGLYWHYFKDMSPAHWDTLIVDSSGPASRALALASKQPALRIIVTSLTLDWQRQSSLLENFLTYVVEGRQSTALLSDGSQSVVSFEYLVAALQSRRFPFRRYEASGNLEALSRYIETEVHSTLLLAPQVQENALPLELKESIGRAIDRGSLQTITMSASGIDGSSGMYTVRSRHRFARQLLQQMQLAVQNELRAGYIDGSFWSTVETLQSLESMSGPIDYKFLLGKVLLQVDTHDRDGSYDEVFGASCATFWLRSRYLGISDRRSAQTLRWIRRALHQHGYREKLQAYTVLCAQGVIRQDELDEFARIVCTADVNGLSQSDLNMFIRAALAVGDAGKMSHFVGVLTDQVGNEGWVDLATSAESASLLLDVQQVHSNNDHSVSEKTDALIFSVIVGIQNSLSQAVSRGYSGPYPWGGKASCSAKCLLAWLKFDERLTVPVYDVIESLERQDSRAMQYAFSRTSLAVLEQLKRDNDRLVDKCHDLEREKSKAASALKTRRFLVALTVAFAYVIGVQVYGATIDGPVKLLKIVERSFVDTWPVTSVVLSLIVALLAVPWDRFSTRATRRSDKSS